MEDVAAQTAQVENDDAPFRCIKIATQEDTKDNESFWILETETEVPDMRELTNLIRAEVVKRHGSFPPHLENLARVRLSSGAPETARTRRQTRKTMETQQPLTSKMAHQPSFDDLQLDPSMFGGRQPTVPEILDYLQSQQRLKNRAFLQHQCQHFLSNPILHSIPGSLSSTSSTQSVSIPPLQQRQSQQLALLQAQLEDQLHAQLAAHNHAAQNHAANPTLTNASLVSAPTGTPPILDLSRQFPSSKHSGSLPPLAAPPSDVSASESLLTQQVVEQLSQTAETFLIQTAQIDSSDSLSAKLALHHSAPPNFLKNLGQQLNTQIQDCMLHFSPSSLMQAHKFNSHG